MNKQEALYFLEGLTCQLAAPSATLAKALFIAIALEFGVVRTELETVRQEIDRYLDAIDDEEEEPAA